MLPQKRAPIRCLLFASYKVIDVRRQWASKRSNNFADQLFFPCRWYRA